MEIEAAKYGNAYDPNTRFNSRIRRRRQTSRWKNVFDAARNGDLKAVQRYIEEQQVDVNTSLPGSTGNLLSAAAQEGHIDIVRYLISRGADVNFTDRYGYSPLLWVLDKNKADLTVIQLLIENGAEINVQAKENLYTPLHWAVIHNRLDIVKYLVAMNADLNSRTKEGLTPVQEASKRRLTEVFDYLNNNMTRFGNTSGDIFEAAARGDVNAVRYFVEYERKDPFAQNSSGETALHLAASNGKLSVVKYLVEMKSRNVNIQNANGESPLVAATTQGHLHIMKYLIGDRHANPDALDRSGYTPLLIAARLGNVEAIRYLLTRGNANTKLTERDFSNNALHVSAQYGHLNVVSFLMGEKEFNMYSKNKYGDNALHIAARYGHTPIVKYFIDEKDMDFTRINSKGRNVLHAAAEGGNLEVMNYLVDEKHLDIMAKDSSKNTLLHIAVEFDQLQLVKYLLEVRKLDPTTQNTSGLNAVTLAQAYSRQQILSYFVYERGMVVKNPDVAISQNPISKPNDNSQPSGAYPLNFSPANDSINYTQKPAPLYSNYYSSSPKPPSEKPNSGANFSKPSVKPDGQYISGPQFNLQTTQEVINEGNTVKIKQHYLINGKEVDKATVDKAIMEFMKSSAAFNNSSGNRITWGQQTVNDANGTRTKYIVNGQEVDKNYYESIIKQYGSGNPNGVSATFTSATSTQYSPQQYYSPSTRKKRNVSSSSEVNKIVIAALPPYNSFSPMSVRPLLPKNTNFQTTSKAVSGEHSHNLPSEFGGSDINNFLVLFNFTMHQVKGNQFQHMPKHESLMSPNEIIENRIDHEAIDAVSGFYNF